MSKLDYLKGFLDYYRTKNTIIQDPFYFPMAREIGARKIDGGYDISNLLEIKIIKGDYDFPEKFKRKLDFFKEDGKKTLQNIDKAVSYFERVKAKINSGKFRGTEIADFLYAVWGVFNLNYELAFGRAAMVKEKTIGNTIMKKASIEDIINASIEYILSGKEPNIWFFNNELTGYIKKRRHKREW